MSDQEVDSVKLVCGNGKEFEFPEEIAVTTKRSKNVSKQRKRDDKHSEKELNEKNMIRVEAIEKRTGSGRVVTVSGFE